MVSIPEGSFGSLTVVARERDLRTEQQKIFDQLREEAMADANKAYEAKERILANQSNAFKTQILKSGFMNFAIDIQDISDLMGMLQLMRHEYPEFTEIIAQVEQATYENPPSEAQEIRDLFSSLIRRDESLDPDAMQRANQMMKRMDELLMMPEGLLELLEERQRSKKI